MQTDARTEVHLKEHTEPDQEHEKIAALLQDISEMEKRRDSAEVDRKLDHYYRLLLQHLREL